MSKFETVNEVFENQFETVKKEYFPELVNCKIKPLFYTKKKKKDGMVNFAYIQKANDLIKYLTSDEVEEGYDFVVFFDKNIIENIESSDRERIIRHELRHVEFDDDSNKPYKLRGHEVEDFFEELELNSDDPRWKDRVSAVAESIYEEE